MNKHRPIAIFDSGTGGLTVAKEIHRILPYERIVYFGDTARVPYGTKSKETIVRYARQITIFLMRFNPKIVVIACHSVSSIAFNTLCRNFPHIKFADVITPSVTCALKTTRNHRIGVIGTTATISSRRYEFLLKRADSRVKIYASACPLFVPLAEEGWLTGQIPLEVARRYLSPLVKHNIDTLVLGCTHYGLLKRTIKKVVGESVALIDAAEVTSRWVKDILDNDRGSDNGAPETPVLYFSDLAQNHWKVLKAFWGSDDLRVYKGVIE